MRLVLFFFFSKKEIGESEKYFQKINPFINLRNRDKKKKKIKKPTHIHKQIPKALILSIGMNNLNFVFFLDRPLKLVKILYM